MVHNFCQCGCGANTKNGNRFILGHNARVFPPMRGKKHTEETKQKLSTSHQGPRPWRLGFTHTPETREQLSKSHKNVPLSEEHKKMIGIASKKVWAEKSPDERREWHEKIGFGNRGKTIPNEVRIKMSELHKGKRFSPKTEFKKGAPSLMKGLNHSKETKEIISIKAKQMWKNPEIVKKILSSVKSPNKAELKLFGIIDLISPNQWKFVGDGQAIIAGKCPDFINVNGQKKIIELFGDYWHRGENPQDRVNVFKPFGYDTLVIWEKELLDLDCLTEKIKSFCEVVQ